MPYTELPERYVAFIDILGFSDVVRSLTPDDARLDHLRFVLAVHDFAAKMLRHEHTLSVTSFSDNVVASAPLTPEGLGDLIHFSFQMSWLNLLQGYLCRGAIVRGRLVHDTDAVFGPGLVTAYEMETQVAKVPRIIFTDEVAQDVRIGAPGDHYLQRILPHIITEPERVAYLDTLCPVGRTESFFWDQKPADSDLHLIGRG